MDPHLPVASIVTAPEALAVRANNRAIFLAGSIEQGAAVDWQRLVIDALSDRAVTIFNPRRAQWDASWPQRAEHPLFREQVEWELAALDRADVIAMYLDPATRSPISLLELGLYASSRKLVVCCPDGFWRKGNVDIVCERFAITQVPSLDALVAALRAST